ncbi:MAG TPA: NBR1-Ig-like domain-containing protein [Anaerolineales bacterium]
MKSRIPVGLLMMLVALVLSFVPAATIAAQPAAASSVCDWAQFITDVTVPDGMNFAPGATFTKTWRIKNIGTCTWTTSYALVFSSGNQLGGPSSANLKSNVAPGDTFDFSINLKAPNAAGNYTGFWQLKNASGVLFGIGSTANKTWWVEINVSGGSTTPGVAYDFAANYCSANWTSTAGSLPCPGTDGAPNGFVLQVSNPTLEDGSTVSGLGLITNPQNGFNGDIHGAFPPFHVQNGDHFKSIVNCSRNAPNCFVTFRLDYQIGNGSVNTFWTFREKFDGLFFPANIDLSPLAGQDVKFILTVLATGSPTGDRALWVNPVITRAGAVPPTPGPGTPGPTAIPPTACDRAQFMTDVTVPDGTAFAPGAAITKTWRLKNVGTCTWTTAYSMAFDSGAQMGGPNSVPMPKTVNPGDTVNLTVNLTAPTATGSYKGFWSFRNASGVRFGLGSTGTISWWVDIKVSGAPISFQYDFGTTTSPVAVGYTRVTESTAYTAGGFGWTDTSTLESRDRGGPDDLKRDFVMSSSAARTFKVDLPNKTYTVVVTQGDANFAHDKMVVKANGTTVLSNVTTAAGSFAVNSFTATVSNGSLSLEFSDAGGSDPTWVVNGVLISNVTPLPSDCDRAQFVADVTVPDGTVFAPNSAITKTWSLKNIGTCTWTTSYSLVFDSRDKMGGPDSVAMPKTVAPGDTVNVTVNLIAPSSAGSYRGFWKFQNASGVRFGIGPGGTSPWWVAIQVVGPTATPGTPTPGTPTPTTTPVAGLQYDFAANACSAVWLSGAVKLPNKLPCPGTDGDSRGFVLPVSSPKLETGAVDPRMGLVTFPQNVFNGYIQGIYPPYHVQAGDRFRSIVNCSFGATSCFVVFRLDYQTGTDPIKNFWAFVEKYDNKFGTADLDLSSLAGKDVKFILTVLSAGSPTGDRALWVAPMIFNAAGVTPTVTPVPSGTPATPAPTSSTAGWTSFTNTKYGFSFQIPTGSTISSQTDNNGLVYLPILTTGTNLGQKYIEVKVVDGATASTCKDPYTSGGTSPAYTSANVTFNGIQFLKETDTQGAASNIYDWVGYSTLQGTSCITLTFILHSTNPGVFTTPPPLFDKAAESAIFPTIMSTFAFSNLPVSATNTPTATATPPATASTASVSIMNISFQPSSLQVKAGTTVTWTNNDNTAHTVTSDTAGVFDSGTLAVGTAFSFTFTQTGTFAYHCNIHSSMHGTITVVP